MESKKAEIGMILFIAAELMFFAGLLSAYWVLRSQLPSWPPVDQPRFPILVTGINTAILLASGFAMYRTIWAIKKGCYLCLTALLGIASLGGLLFLLIQGYEWLQLIRFGLGTAHNIYGGLFYLLVGAHGAHVTGGLLFLLFILVSAARDPCHVNFSRLSACRFFWSFVVLLWPVIYVSLYLV